MSIRPTHSIRAGNSPPTGNTIAMLDKFPSLSWYPQPETWPYWMPNSLLDSAFTLPPPPNHVWEQSLSTSPRSPTRSSSTGGLLGDFEQPNDTWGASTGLLDSALQSNADGGLLSSLSQPNDLWNPTSPSSLHSATPWRTYGGIPADLRQPDETWDASTSGWLGSAPFPNAGGGLLRNFEQSNDSSYPSNPSWLSSAMPPSANGGIFRGAPTLPSTSALPPAFPHSLPSGIGSTAGSSPVPFGENAGSRGAPASVGRTEPNGIQLAGMASPFPGMMPPIPPVVVPGLPEWSDHFVRGLQGLINAFKSSGRRGGRRSEDDDYCSDRMQAEMGRCYGRQDEYAHRDFLPACIERARYRWRLCLQNKGRPDPNEPPEWGPKDEEIWRNPRR